MMRLAVVLCVLLSAGAAQAAELAGMAKVMDADKIIVEGQRIKLYGVEGIERKQTCRMDGAPWDCYANSVRQLEILVANEPVHCEQIGDRDTFGRIVGRCTIGDQDLSELLIRQGWGLTRRDTADYAVAEEAAKAEELGLWQTEFSPPWEWREAIGIFTDDP